LESLELIERREIRILVIEMNHESDRDQVIVVVIEKGAAAGIAPERPAECMLHQARVMFFGRDLPQLLEPEPEFLRLAAFVETKPGNENLTEAAACAFGQQGVSGTQFHTARKTVLAVTVARNAHVAGRNAGDCAFFIEQNLGGGKAGINFHSESFCLPC